MAFAGIMTTTTDKQEAFKPLSRFGEDESENHVREIIQSYENLIRSHQK